MTKLRYYIPVMFFILLISYGSDTAAMTQGANQAPAKVKGMVGQTVIFLPQGLGGTDAPYINMRKGFGAAEKPWMSSELAWKKARISEYKEAEGSAFPVRFYLKLDLEGGGEVWYVDQGTGDYVKEIVLESQLNAAKKWVGKTIWVRDAAILNLFKDSPLSAKASENTDDMLKAKNTEKMTLLHVDLTNSGLLPFLFRVQRGDNTQGYIAAGSSVDTDLARRFYLTDPRKEHKWPAAVWKMIEDGRVQLGMTEEQVRMAWGEADWERKDEKSEGGKEWAYSINRLYFTGSRLTSMTEVPVHHGEKKEDVKEKGDK